MNVLENHLTQYFVKHFENIQKAMQPNVYPIRTAFWNIWPLLIRAHEIENYTHAAHSCAHLNNKVIHRHRPILFWVAFAGSLLEGVHCFLNLSFTTENQRIVNFGLHFNHIHDLITFICPGTHLFSLSLSSRSSIVSSCNL